MINHNFLSSFSGYFTHDFIMKPAALSECFQRMLPDTVGIFHQIPFLFSQLWPVLV